ncbi:MAG: 30S ribosomal protein S8 [Thermoprotei archaeon]
MSFALSYVLDALDKAEKRGKREAVVYPASKLAASTLAKLHELGYIGDFEYIDDGRNGKFRVELLGRINKCGSIRPPLFLNRDGLIKGDVRFLPGKGVGALLLSTPYGVLTTSEARDKKIGGVLIAYVY